MQVIKKAIGLINRILKYCNIIYEWIIMSVILVIIIISWFYKKKKSLQIMKFYSVEGQYLDIICGHYVGNLFTVTVTSQSHFF